MPERSAGRPGQSWLQLVARQAQLHPWRTMEHCALIVLVLTYIKGEGASHTGQALAQVEQKCPAGESTCCCPSEKPGALSALEAAGVSEAPPASMNVDKLTPGQVAEHHDFRGEIYKFAMGEKMILNIMKTFKGTMRSGDLHNCTQYDVVLGGKTRLHTKDLRSSTETVREYDRNAFIKIPARTAHLFEFLEENYMIEWWDCDFKAWYYQPYRDRIAQQFEQAGQVSEAKSVPEQPHSRADVGQSEQQAAANHAKLDYVSSQKQPDSQAMVSGMEGAVGEGDAALEVGAAQAAVGQQGSVSQQQPQQRSAAAMQQGAGQQGTAVLPNGPDPVEDNDADERIDDTAAAARQ